MKTRNSQEKAKTYSSTHKKETKEVPTSSSSDESDEGGYLFYSRGRRTFDETYRKYLEEKSTSMNSKTLRSSNSNAEKNNEKVEQLPKDPNKPSEKKEECSAKSSTHSPSPKKVKLNKKKEECSAESSTHSPTPKRVKLNTNMAESWCHTQIVAGNTNFKWTIQNICLSSNDVGEPLESSSFKILQGKQPKWCLKVFPKGHCEKCRGYICIFVNLLSEVSVNVKSEIVLMKSDGVKILSKDNIKIFNSNNREHRFCKIISKNYLFTELPDDTLVIFCKLTVDFFNIQSTNIESKVLSEFDCKVEVLSDLEKVMKSNAFHDLIIGTKDDKFLAHKAILGTRSTFLKELINNAEERGSNEIKIDNVDHETVTEVMRFIYTGKVQGIENLAIKLYDAANVFNLDNLKTMCETYLSKSLSVSNVFDILNLADESKSINLKAQAFTFIAAHGMDIVNSGTSSLKNLNPNLTEEIFRFMLLNNCS